MTIDFGNNNNKNDIMSTNPIKILRILINMIFIFMKNKELSYKLHIIKYLGFPS